MRTPKKLILSTMALGLALSTAACGSSSGDSGGSSSGGSDSKALAGTKVVVGSKDFTENILLGKIYAQALKAQGADVTDQTNLGGSAVNRKALLSGDINVYPEYNGTGWTVHLGNEKPSSDPQTLFDMTSKEDLAKNKVAWVGRSPFNDTYGFAANGDLAKKEGDFDLKGMAAYLKANPKATLCLETEFPDRPDGLTLFEKATGYKVPRSQIKILDTGLIYTQTSKGNCQFGEIFTTDGRILALNLQLVKDPGVFILYNVSFTWQNAAYQKHKADYDKMTEAILKPLDEKKMAELNKMVDVDGVPADKVAEDYLKEIGLV